MLSRLPDARNPTVSVRREDRQVAADAEFCTLKI